MKSHVYSVEGTKGAEISLPAVFEEKYLPKVIARAVVAKQSKKLQPKGNDVLAGLKTTAEYIGRRSAFRTGINRGMSRLPRIKRGGGGLGQVRIVPGAVGGRRAHPPKAEKVIVKQINKKERLLAVRSAIAATTNKALVEARGHVVDGIAEVPIIFEDKFEDITKTKDAVKALESVGLKKDLTRGRVKKVRAGKATSRGKKYKRRKSVLVVVSKGGKALQNVPGVDVMTAGHVDIEKLAPGSKAGRLTVYTASAIKQLGEKYGN